MKTLIRACVAAVPLLALSSYSQTIVWNPAANPASTGLWSEAANWQGGVVPGIANKVVFNVGTAISCRINSIAEAGQLVIGDGNAGSVVITQGGAVQTGTEWSAVSYNSLARLEVQTGGSVVFGGHLWVGLTGTGDGTLVLNGGTVTVNQMFGLGWDGGKGTAQVNGGTLYLKQWNGTQSISGNSTLDIQAGKVIITGDVTGSVDAYITAGKITGYGGIGTVTRIFNTESNATILTASKIEGAGGPYAPTAWPTNIDPAKVVHFYSADSSLAAPNANWVDSLNLCDQGATGGDQAVADVLNLGTEMFLGKRAISDNLNILDQSFEAWANVPEIDILLQVYGDAGVVKPSDGNQGRRIEFLTGTLPSTALIKASTFSAGVHNLKWNWLLLTVTNSMYLEDGVARRQIGTVKAGVSAQYGGVNGGTIRLQGPDNNVNGLTIRAVAFGEKGAFGTANDINQFLPADGSCPEVLDHNLVGLDFNAGITNHLQVINDANSGQVVTYVTDAGPAGDKRKAVRTDWALNFGILDNYLGQACNENVTVKVCLDYYDDPQFAGNNVVFGPESWANDRYGSLAFANPNTQVTLRGTGQWLRQSWVISGVNLYGVSTAPLTGGPRFFVMGGSIAVSRVEMAVLRTTGPLAGQDPLSDCYPDPLICLGVYGDFAELDLAAGVTNGLDLGTSSGDQTFVVETSGPAADQRLAVRGDTAGGYFLNFQILTNALGPTSQGNLHMAIVVTYYDDPAKAGVGFRPQVWKYHGTTGSANNYLGGDRNLVLQGTGKWREAYWEIGRISLDGINQGPQAAARFQTDGGKPVHISRVRYAVIRPCGTSAGQNQLSSTLTLAAKPEPNSILKLSWPYKAPQAVLQSVSAIGETWAPFNAAVEFDGENATVRMGPTNGVSRFFRLSITPP